MGIAIGWKLAVQIGWLLSMVSLYMYVADAPQDKGVTVKGEVVQGERKDLQIDLSQFPITLKEDVYDKLPTPRLPENWDAMDLAQKQAYAEKFEASEAGKKMLAEREKILAQANDFDVILEKSGQFVVYDVPPGIYELRGRKDVKTGASTYAFEVFGQVLVGDEVDEIILDPVMILVTPLFERGQPAPQIAVELFQGQQTVDKSLLDGKPVFLMFWSAEFSPPSVAFQPQVQEMYLELKEKHGLQLVCVSLDPSRKTAQRTINERRFQGYHGFAPGWEHPMVEAFGVRALPYFLLLDADGKIAMTHPEIREAFANGQTLGQLVEQRLTGQTLENEGKPKNQVDGSGG
ncbi:MAG: thioredoxin family protein [Planctomycetota bacterium]|nr:thioredoxin family protein [Planctomycetota bacterium]